MMIDLKLAAQAEAVLRKAFARWPRMRHFGWWRDAVQLLSPRHRMQRVQHSAGGYVDRMPPVPRGIADEAWRLAAAGDPYRWPAYSRDA